MSGLNRQHPGNQFAKLLNDHLNKRNWNAAELSRRSGVSKATITRLMAYRSEGERIYEPTFRTICALALALELETTTETALDNKSEYAEFLEAAYPWWSTWLEATKKKKSVIETNIDLKEKGLPTLDAK